jgi:hypothetical protein
MGTPLDDALDMIAAGGTCQKLAIGIVAVQSSVINANVIHITPSVDCYARTGSNPTALSTGVDHFLLGQCTHEFQFVRGEKLSIIVALGTGVVHIAPVR